MGITLIKDENIQCVLKWEAIIGECPTWSSQEQKLYWVDISEKKVHCFNPSSGTNKTIELPEIVPCIALREKGGLVLTLKKEFAIFNPETEKLQRIKTVESDLPQNRFNDGKCDPGGRFWAGTMDSLEWKKPAGNLFCLQPDFQVRHMEKSVICSNGLGWSPDMKTMYFTESFRYSVFAYDYDLHTGAISNRRLFMEMDKSDGRFPDGLTVDAEGFVWSNIVGPGEIHRFDPKGKLERVLKFPVPRATSCTFGGPDLKTLYVTSSRETLSAPQLKEAPLSGSLFAVPTETPGLPTFLFKG
ncbi:MAG: SMP-30/gluconolactonase/LRE family protein [Pseudobdellovibrionaceae bacterium]